MTSDVILRYQDREGRGPFRPGIPAIWADARGDRLPDVFTDFPGLLKDLPKYHAAGLNIGCACAGRGGIDAYFTTAEQARLAELGYRLHRVPSSAVVLRSRSQVVFVWPRPFKQFPKWRE